MRPEKHSILQEVTSRLQEAEFVFVMNYGGLQVAELTELRKSLLALNSRAMVVKNSYLSKAAESLGWDDISALLTGPTAVVTGSGDIAEVAKVLMAFIKGHDKASVKGGNFEGQLLTVDDVNELTTIPPRQVLYAMVAGTLAAPMTQLAGVFSQKLCSLLYVLKAAEEKKNNDAA
ncbi:MAG: 50S ribosomal protein L10 [Lentisphaerae bacterium]|jgi:large subunit ribosomal protein L10|nr:50S ribosomal protein L10 [Lentisphaerota bacterium]